ncbi:MAG: hypothetical protein JWO56_836, partial [Acidobacteria bacterium]|nr:hypothetical protein [Acidobacteriota bacterium]
FRDNYTFIPSASYSGANQKICSTVAASLAENNVWETDYAGGGVHFLGVYYHTDSSVYPKYPILVRNERFISPDGTGIRAADSGHDNNFPFSGGISAIGDEIDLGNQRIKYGASAPTSGSFSRGDLIFNSKVQEAGETNMGWVCVREGTAGVDAVFRTMPLLGA